ASDSVAATPSERHLPLVQLRPRDSTLPSMRWSATSHRGRLGRLLVRAASLWCVARPPGPPRQSSWCNSGSNLVGGVGSEPPPIVYGVWGGGDHPTDVRHETS